ncbi:MAG: hypothetical protein J6I32_03210 [Bacteroidaceae bacterium]|nr:hypothetical protein [Bacteroidaceae bacterium]
MENKNYEWVELPSKGQCYPINSPLREGKVKVSYLTAMDENVFVSEKLIKEERVCDVLLKNKVVDVDSFGLCAGDKEAIVLWLRKTGYGNLYENPSTKNTVDLDKVKYKDFNMIADSNGNFNYHLPNGGLVKFCYLPYKEEEELIRNTVNTLKSIEDNEDTSYIDVYRKVAIPLLFGMIVSVNGFWDVEKWLLELDFDTLRQIQRYITRNSPGLKLETTEGIVFDDSIFYDITAKLEIGNEYDIR